MCKVKCTRKNIKGMSQVIEGYIAKKIYNYSHDVVGYEVKYKADRGCMICLEKDFDIKVLG